MPDEVSLTVGMPKAEKKAFSLEMVQLQAGQQHTMILKKDGSVYSWGLGLSGQLGFSFDQMAAADLVVAQ